MTAEAADGASVSVEFSDAVGGFAVAGAVDYRNAESVMTEGISRLEAAGGSRASVRVELSGLKSATGSLIVALMLAWLRHATNADVKVEFAGVPDTYREIVDVSGLEDTLALVP